MITCDLVVIGAGPAGTAAASQAASHGASVVVLDEQARPGGQVYRDVQIADAGRKAILGPDYAAGQPLADSMTHANIRHITKATVWDVTADALVSFSCDGVAQQVQGQRLVIASGALERPMPLPGWTLPGVTTAGAAQILLKSHGVIAEKAVIAGSGPLIYLLAAQMIAAGSPPLALIETQSMADGLSALKYLPGGLRGWRVLTKGLGLIRSLSRAGVRRYSGATNLQVQGDETATSIHFQHRNQPRDIACSTVLLHHGVVPNTQISQALGLSHHWHKGQRCFHPDHDGWGETSTPGVFVVGDGAGIGGALAAEIRGRLAALEVTYQLGLIGGDHRNRAATPLRRNLSRKLAVRPFLDALYPPVAEALAPTDDVIICRCEEVTAGDIRAYAGFGCLGPNQTKAFGRSGMGPCQGRYCGLSVTEILARETGQSHDAVGSYRIRAPLKPVTLGEMATLAELQNPKQEDPE